jgi:hypothetical protein
MLFGGRELVAAQSWRSAPVQDAMDRADDNKNEFDWEQSFRESDDFARHYFRLLRRYGELPDGEDLITAKLVKIFGEDFVDAMYGYDDFFSESELSSEEEMGFDVLGPEFGGEEDPAAEDASAAADDKESGKGFPGPPGAENIDRHCHELIMILTQTAMGWCNLYSCLLSNQQRGDGLRVMFFVSRALANISVSLEELIRWEINAALARAKRCLDNVNQAIGLILGMKGANPPLQEVMNNIQTQLIKCADDLGEYIRQCRVLGKDDLPF